MPAIPDPEELLERAQSINRTVEDREWKQYQRYLAKHEEKYGDPPIEQPLSFDKFCAWLKFYDKHIEDMQDPPIYYGSES